MILYYLLEMGISNLYVLSLFIFSFVIIAGILMSKLAIEPLVEYTKNLQNLSKETLHELNLPVSTIITNTQMLSKSLNDEKSIRRIKRINSACQMLQERYNELDYMIKMQSRVNVQERFFVDELLKERVAFLSKLYPYINFNLELEPIEIVSDKKGLAKVIDNIIDNGVKYSHNSKEIDINTKENSIFIKDYGTGMDEVVLVKLFEQFYQSNKNMQGFGIGLSMVKRFCDKNEIKLLFKSTPNVGTTVELKFKDI